VDPDVILVQHFTGMVNNTKGTKVLCADADQRVCLKGKLSRRTVDSRAVSVRESFFMAVAQNMQRKTDFSCLEDK
jgi:hypothetical protein